MRRFGASPWLSFVLLAGAACEDDTGAIGVQGDLRAPTVVDLGDLPVGLSLTRTVPLQNVGSGRLTLTGAEVLQTGDGQQITLSSVDTDSLDPGQTFGAEFEILMLTTQSEPVDARLRFSADAGDGLTQTAEVIVRSRGTDRTLLIRPQPVDFGSVRVGTRATRTVEVINMLSEPVDLLVPFAASEASFEEGDRVFDLLATVDTLRQGSLLPEGERLQPGEAFELEFEYAPSAQASGERDEGLLEIRSCPDQFCLNLIELRGRGVRSGLACDPSSVSFGALRPGRFESAFVRCTNVSNVDIEVLSWSLASESDPEFGVEPFSGEGVVYRSGETFEFEVTFSPTPDRLGEALFGRVDISARTPGDVAPTIQVEVDLEGSPGGPVAVLSPNPIAMGDVAVGQVGRVPLTLSNVGFADLEVETVRFEGNFQDAFRLEPNPRVISQQQSLEMILSFSPDAAGSIDAQLVLETNDPLQPQLVAPISGRALDLDLNSCAIQKLPASVEYGLVPVGATTRRDFSIRNTGTGACIVRDFRLNDPDAVYRLVRAPAPSALILPDETTTLSVQFVPSEERVYERSVDFSVSTRVGGDSVRISGAGGLGDILVAPTEIDFGNVRLGCQAPEQVVQVRNISGQEIGITRFEFQGDDEISLPQLPPGLPPAPGGSRPVSPGQFFEIPVRFQPTATGESFATLSIEVSGQNGTNTVQMRGRSSDQNRVVERFSQAENPKVDLLWVIDNSFSMQQEISFLRATADDIFQALVDAEIDYQTAVISTDMIGDQTSPCGFVGSSPQGMWRRGSCGFFSDGDENEQRNEWRIVDPLSVPTAVGVFRRITELPFPGPATERGLQAMVAALTPPQTLGWNRGFLRPDANLAVIILSDEEDQSAGTIDTYVSTLLALKPGLETSATLSAVVPPASFRCITGQPIEDCPPDFLSRVENNYAQAALLTNGVALSSELDGSATEAERQAEYAQILFDVTFSSISLRSIFPLRDIPVPGSILILVDGVPLPATSPGGDNWRFEGAANRVVFTERGLPLPGSSLELQYDALCLNEG